MTSPLANTTAAHAASHLRAVQAGPRAAGTSLGGDDPCTAPEGRRRRRGLVALSEHASVEEVHGTVALESTRASSASRIPSSFVAT